MSARLLFAGMLASLATGCATTVREDWESQASLPPLPTAYLVVKAGELAAYCGNYPGATLHGCARRDYAARKCTIVTGPQPAAWLLDHERKHCAGYDHSPAYGTQNTSRTAALSHLH